MSSQRKNSQTGMTLIEVILAIGVMATGLALLTATWSATYGRMQKTQLNFEIASLLERKMTELELEFRGKPISEIPEEKSDTFGEGLSQYSWRIEAKELEIPDLTSTLTSKDGGADAMMISLIKQLTDNLGKSVKELKLTVIYSPGQGRKNLEASVTRYFIDFDKPMNFGVPQ